MTAAQSLIRAPMRGVMRGVMASAERYDDGIHLDFRSGRHYVKAPGVSPLVLPFTSLFTFTRAAPDASFRGVNGLLQYATTNVPRIDYDENGNCLGLLAEAARTNVALSSELLDNGDYAQANVTVTANAFTAPDGNATADRIVETTATTPHRIRNNIALTIAADTLYTYSVFVRADQRFRLNLRWTDTIETNGVEANFNLNAAVVSGVSNIGTGTGASARMVAYANGWYRCSLTGIAGAGNTSAQFRLNLLDDTGSFSYAGDTARGLYAWGVQVEAGQFGSSYIPTAGSPVTRAADVCTRTLGGEFSATVGTVVTGGSASSGRDTVVQRVFAFHDGTDGERTHLARPVAGDFARYSVQDGGANQTTMDFAFTNSTVFKAALAWGLNDFAYAFNGAAPQTDATGTIPTTPTLEFGLTGIQQMNGHIRKFDYWPERKSNAFLQAASAL